MNPYERRIDGRKLGDIRVHELIPLAAKKRRDAEQYMSIAAAAQVEGDEQWTRHRDLAEQAMADYLLLQKIADHLQRRS